MKWKAADLETFLQEKEYIDTAFIPLVPLAWSKNVKSTVSAGEYTLLMTDELERQLKGRVVLFPAFSYGTSESLTDRCGRLSAISQELSEAHFKHIFYFTSDVDWKDVEGDLDFPLIWLPHVPLEHMDERHRRDMVADQLKPLLQIVTKKWQEIDSY